MSFAHPVAGVVATVASIAIVMLLVRADRVRTQGSIAYSNLAFLLDALQPNPWIDRLLSAALCIGIAGITCSLGGPHSIATTAKVDRTVAICIDTSGSMSSGDIAPTRAKATIASLKSFVAHLPRETQVAIIAFASDARVILPLTADRASIERGLQTIPPPNGATAIGDALEIAGRELIGGDPAILLLTDGVNNRGRDPLLAVAELAGRHIPIHAIGIGKATGDVMPGTSERATIDWNALQKYASMSSGTFHTGSSAQAVKDALARLAENIGYTHRNVDLSYPLAVGGGILALLAVLAAFFYGRIP